MGKFSRRQGNSINRVKVIVLMTVAVFFVLSVLTALFFKGFPPWPLLACFAASHTFFCIVISRVKPFKGPYSKPMDDADPDRWPG
jgi:hypothetical protein